MDSVPVWYTVPEYDSFERVWPHVLAAPDLKVVARAEYASQSRGAASAATARAAMASGGAGRGESRKQSKKEKRKQKGKKRGSLDASQGASISVANRPHY